MSQYIEILARQRPFPYGVDESGRTLIACNFDARAIAPVSAWELEIAKLINQSGNGTLGVDMTIGPAAPVPNGQSVVVTLIDTGGSEPEEVHYGDKFERLSVQVIVRSSDYQAAMTRSLAIWRLLDGQRGITVTLP